MALHKFFLHDRKELNIVFFSTIILITIIMLFSMTFLTTDTDVTKLLPDNDLIRYEREKINNYKNNFQSNDNSIFIAVDFENMDSKKYEKLKKFSGELENLKIDGEKIVANVLSPFNAVYFKKSGDTFIPKFLLKGVPFERINEVLDEAKDNSYIFGSVVSYDRKSFGFLVNMNENAKLKGIDKKNIYHFIGEKIFGKNYDDRKLDRLTFSNKVYKLIKSYEKDFKIYYAGVPIYEALSEKYMLKDIVLLFTPSLLMMIIILFLNFRSVRGMVLPIIGMVLSVIWTLGLMSFFRYKISVVGILIPPMILTIGSSYTLHYLNSYYQNSEEKDRKKLVIKSTKLILPTIFMASITTIIGFTSFFVAKMSTIRMFGFWIVVSIVLTLFFTFFVLSKLLYNLDVPDIKNIMEFKNDIFSRMLVKIEKVVLPFYVLWIILFFITIIVFFLTFKRINIETNAANFFKETDPVKVGLTYIQKNYKGTISFNITVSTDKNNIDFFRNRENLLLVDKVCQFIEQNPGYDKVVLTGWKISIVSMLKDLNKIVYGEYKIPEDQKIIDRFFNLILASKSSFAKGLVNEDLTSLNIQVRTYSDRKKVSYSITEQELAKLNNFYNLKLEQLSKEIGLKIETWGEPLLLSKISKYLLEDQLSSLIFTLIFILIVVTIVFRSFYYALISTIPLLFGIMMNFIIMSLFGITLNVATIMIGAISMGVGIDSSLHFLLNFRRIKKENPDLSLTENLINTLNYTSRPILFASLALLAGFIVFALSTFIPVFFFGLLIAISMLNCTFATLVILPSFILVFDKVKNLFQKDKK